MDRIRAAGYGLLVMYAWDMCDLGLRDVPPKDDPRIAASGWKIIGYIIGSDDILKSGSSVRMTVLGSSSAPADRVAYGYVAQRPGPDGTQTVAVIRGTDGAEEWCDDLDFLMMLHPQPAAGLVDQGFFSIYSTMEYVPVIAGPAGPALGAPVALAQGIKAALALNGPGTAPADANLYVLGHSLGAALGTYLTLDLNLGGCAASACLFASPRPGNQTFADFFESQVKHYDVFNYELDVVPKVPFADVLHLSRYVELAQAKTIAVSSAQARIEQEVHCNHHMICYIAMLDYKTYQAACADPAFTSDDRKCAQCVCGSA